jgi:hypothetical protein
MLKTLTNSVLNDEIVKSIVIINKCNTTTNFLNYRDLVKMVLFRDGRSQLLGLYYSVIYTSKLV